MAKPKVITAEEVLAKYRVGTGPGIVPHEEELLKPLPLEDWEAMREDDRNAW